MFSQNLGISLEKEPPLILLNLHQLLGRRAIDTKEVLDDEVVEL